MYWTPVPQFHWVRSHGHWGVPLPNPFQLKAHFQDMLGDGTDISKHHVPWEKKIPKVFWRGSLSAPDYVVARDLGTIPRVRLQNLAKRHPDLFDVAITSVDDELLAPAAPPPRVAAAPRPLPGRGAAPGPASCAGREQCHEALRLRATATSAAEMRPQRAVATAWQAFVFVVSLDTQDDASRRRSPFTCEEIKESGFCDKVGPLGDEARQTCQMSCGVGCRGPCEADQTSRRRFPQSCREMFDAGICGTDGALGLEMEETCRTTCHDALGCLPPCEPDQTSRRRSQRSCQQMFDEGFCGVGGPLGEEAAETCRSTCADTFECVAQEKLAGTDTSDSNSDANLTVEPLPDQDLGPVEASSWQHSIFVFMGVIAIGCCCVCMFARVWSSHKDAEVGRLDQDRLVGQSGLAGAGAAVEPVPSGRAERAEQAVQQATAPADVAKVGPLEGTPAGGASASLDAVFLSIESAEGADEPVSERMTKPHKKTRVKKPRRQGQPEQQEAVSVNPAPAPALACKSVEVSATGQPEQQEAVSVDPAPAPALAGKSVEVIATAGARTSVSSAASCLSTKSWSAALANATGPSSRRQGQPEQQEAVSTPSAGAGEIVEARALAGARISVTSGFSF
ncbi:unnamed protein product [Prorocentrum cordatum]|nr:unnamed protein product [Polarella glacialis]